MNGMRRLISTLALTLVTCIVVAQNPVYDYVHINYEPPSRTVVVHSTTADLRTLDLNDLNKKEYGRDMSSAMAIVQEYEALGWELYSFEHYAVPTTIPKWSVAWLMRKAQ
jgi:hypothetical protein